MRQKRVTDDFDIITEQLANLVDNTDNTHSKPDPEVFLMSAGKIGIDPDDCTVVEDAKAGIEAAKADDITALTLFGDA